jgi:hypothetical protein
MRFDEEIARAVKHQVVKDRRAKNTQDEIDNIVATVRTATINAQYDFSQSEPIVRSQNGNKRFVKKFADYSVECILCQCIKQILDRVFRVKYPNRNESVRSLFGVLSAVKQMSDFTIVKFDFKDFFNSISTIYVFEKFLKTKLCDRFEIDLIYNFAKKTKYAYAGFSTSNVIAEIIARHFDDIIKKAFISKGVLYFERYIDDGLIIFNEHVEEDECKIILEQALEKVFGDKTISGKCKTRFNSKKFSYISKRGMNINLVSFDYLGYKFGLYIKDTKTKIEYGITNDKRNKYNKRVDKLILYYTDTHHVDFNNLELLRHRIAAFTSRAVYRSKRFRADVWKTKGFISNYCELRYLLDTGLVSSDTETFLKNMIDEAFVRASIAPPYFLKGSRGKSGYNLFENMKKNKTLLLVEHIGYNYDALVELCKQIGISSTDKNGIKRGYGNMVREYLIKTKVGY